VTAGLARVDPEPSALDGFIPHPDVRERFQKRVGAPAERLFEVATQFDMRSLLAVRAIFRLRESLLGASPAAPRRPQGIIEETRALGWGTLAQVPGRLIVCGAVCQPWLPDVRFHALEPAAFRDFAEPDQVRIAWTIEAHPLGPDRSLLVQETRVAGTDAPARLKFRRYWRWARFGIVSIRLLLPAVRRAAERRHAREEGAR
jgi:hypothetical protein